VVTPKPNGYYTRLCYLTDKPMKAFEQHCTEQNLELYATGKLDEPGAEILEQHLLLCEPCCDRLVETEKFLGAMRSATAQLREEQRNAPESFVNRIRGFFEMPSATWAAAAVALVLVVVGSTTWLRNGDSTASPVAVSLLAVRGSGAEAPAGQPLDLTLDTRGLEISQSARLEVVNRSGKVMDRANASVSGPQTIFHLRGLPAGPYFIRLYESGSEESAREYLLQLK